MQQVTNVFRRIFPATEPIEEEEPDPAVKLQEKLDQNPDDPELRYDLGSIYYVRGNLTDAIGHLEEAVKLRPGYSEARYMLGLAYEREDRIEDARTEFETAKEKTSNSMLARYAEEKLEALPT